MLEISIPSQTRALQELLAARCATCRQRAMLHGYSTKTTQNFRELHRLARKRAGKAGKAVLQP